MPPRPPDWQLPPGVTSGLWEYLHDPDLAQQYLTKVSDSPFAHADQLFVLKHLPVPCKVVDLGCGPGRSLLPLYKQGFACTGIDLSEHMLDEARKLLSPVFQTIYLGGGKGRPGITPPPTLLQANLGDPLPFDNHSFDAALCLFGTLGMLHPAAIRHSFLTEVHRILKPTGKFLLHVHNRWPIQGLFKRNDVVTLPVHQGISNLKMKLYTASEIQNTLAADGFRTLDLHFIDANHAEGRYTGNRWLAPYRATGFLLAASPN